MKKYFFLLFFALPLVLFQSCGEDEIAELTNYDVPQGQIKGRVLAELDLTNSVYETAPSGTPVTARVSYSQLGIPEAEGVMSTYKYYTTTVNSFGEYVINVDASTAGTTVYIFLDDFAYEQTVGEDLAGNALKTRRVYTVNDFVTTMFSGRTVIRDIYYSAN